MIHCLSLSGLSSSYLAKTPNPNSISASPNPPLFIKFRTSYHQNLRYLKHIGVIDSKTKSNKLPLPDTVDQILVSVEFLKSKGFSDADFARLAFLCPQLFSSDFDPTDIAPVFDFLTTELQASVEESCGLVVKCPQILFSDVEFCLRPTLNYLKQLGLEKLNVPSTLNAHLLNTRVEKLRAKIKFLKSLGFSYEEAKRVCARLPAIFGYSIENNLRPKFHYLVEEMERSVEELKEFPQYFAFSLDKRIAPRHMHLRQRNVKVQLHKMLLLSDTSFYKKWNKTLAEGPDADEPAQSQRQGNQMRRRQVGLGN
ncbi:hypothetical protein HS088_TW07G01281 [Tripterygium wilfordii]|uniref:Mitochondrial transcription termination factor family protein n=1 Tax=Tripterygium wilfordii TaxID=458696 RepID=A0A7J7DHE4_TRIWF|nr:transcription termination factor MTEF1, chloroplastic [Tripterygium wilfordii]KAF5745689.1 hypothetical protein HS088_TW07G01281 [Tripterygium wilfordii]